MKTPSELRQTNIQRWRCSCTRHLDETFEYPPPGQRNSGWLLNFQKRYNYHQPGPEWAKLYAGTVIVTPCWHADAPRIVCCLGLAATQTLGIRALPQARLSRPITSGHLGGAFGKLHFFPEKLKQIEIFVKIFRLFDIYWGNHPIFRENLFSISQFFWIYAKKYAWLRRKTPNHNLRYEKTIFSEGRVSFFVVTHYLPRSLTKCQNNFLKTSQKIWDFLKQSQNISEFSKNIT